MDISKIRKSGEKSCTVTTKSVERVDVNISVPQIRIAGRWLWAVGFNPGKRIRVIYEPNKIVLQVNLENDAQDLEKVSYS